VFSKSEGRVPIYLQTDKGKEFIARPMQKFLKESDICFRVTRNPDIKAAIVERFNRTLKVQMRRYFTHKNTRRYNDVLQDIVHAYNHMRHSIVTRENARAARENIARRWNNDINKKHGRKATSKYHVGDLVRVSRARYLQKRIRGKVEREDISNSSRSRMAKTSRIPTERFSG